MLFIKKYWVWFVVAIIVIAMIYFGTTDQDKKPPFSPEQNAVLQTQAPGTTLTTITPGQDSVWGTIVDFDTQVYDFKIRNYDKEWSGKRIKVNASRAWGLWNRRIDQGSGGVIWDRMNPPVGQMVIMDSVGIKPGTTEPILVTWLAIMSPGSPMSPNPNFSQNAIKWVEINWRTGTVTTLR